ncbi:hypothetical protein AB0D09_02855 [Streptomyces sp. NPDC049097]|uniref:hypothetical protein n=1 Tax=Streptomyces sp. NPDC049097 TaxID=3155497 RepID=UPI00342F5AC8
MNTTGTATRAVPVGRQRGWIAVTTQAVPTVWMATAEGLVCLDLIAVELAANGLRKGWKLTPEEARYTASLLFERGVKYSVIATRIGQSGATLKAWFPEQAVPAEAYLAREGVPRTSSKPPAKCGTRQGYHRHRRLKEEACRPCKDANTASDRHYRLHGTYVIPEPTP